MDTRMSYSAELKMKSVQEIMKELNIHSKPYRDTTWMRCKKQGKPIA